jgi:hypothetical protein
MSQSGQTEKNSVQAYVFRFALKLGLCSTHSACHRDLGDRQLLTKPFASVRRLTSALAMSATRYCRKAPKKPWDQFAGNRPNKPQSPNDVASRPLSKSPVSSSLDNVVPQMIIRSPRVRSEKNLCSVKQKSFATVSAPLRHADGL